jgi:hypothetical protein
LNLGLLANQRTRVALKTSVVNSLYCSLWTAV